MVDGTFIQDRNIDKIPSKRRNPILADIFARLGLMEREGSGIKKMRDSYLEAPNFTKGKEPEFYSDRSQFVMTFPNMNYGVIDKDDYSTGQVTGQDTVQDAGQDTVQDDKLRIGNVTLKALIEFCKQPRSRIELQEYCGLVGRNNYSDKYLKPLLKEGKIKMTLPNKPTSKNQKYYFL